MKLIHSAALLLIAGSLSAKKVKFAVDMTGQTVDASGVHIVGDFQAIAGLGADWDPATAHMTQVGTSNIYTIVVSIPAFKKYEYKFVNGNISYDSEVVPVESRVSLFGDNRWLYVDSLGTDTTYIGALLFGGNAPSGKSLVRYKVNMAHENIPASGAHVGTSSNNYDPTKLHLYSFENSVYEIIDYVSNGTYSYRYFNGNTAGSSETVPSACASSGNRTLTVTKDTVLTEICFATCASCLDVGFKEIAASSVNVKLFPNPASNAITIQSDLSGSYSLSISDYTGRQVKTVSGLNATTANISIADLGKGIYLLKIIGAQGQSQTTKLIVD